MYCWLSTRPELVFRTRTSSTRSVRLPTTFATIAESTEEEEEPSPKSWSKNRLSIVLRGASYIGRQAYLLPVWPDLPKFGHIWLYFKSLWQYFDVFLVSGRILNLHLQCFYASGQIFVVVNGQKLKNNLVIWSHCLLRESWTFWYNSFQIVLILTALQQPQYQPSYPCLMFLFVKHFLLKKEMIIRPKRLLLLWVFLISTAKCITTASS